jgi:hypothetical protein
MEKSMNRVIDSVIRENGVIRALCNSGDCWTPQDVSSVVSDIEGGTFRYWVVGTTMCYRLVVTSERNGQKHLTITYDAEIALDELPEYKIPALAS